MRENPAPLFIDSTTLNDPTISLAKETGEGALAKGGAVQLAAAKHIDKQRTTLKDFKFGLDIVNLIAEL